MPGADLIGPGCSGLKRQIWKRDRVGQNANEGTQIRDGLDNLTRTRSDMLPGLWAARALATGLDMQRLEGIAGQGTVISIRVAEAHRDLLTRTSPAWFTSV